jgi:hypothetical protein
LQGLRDNGQMLRIFDPYKIALVPIPHKAPEPQVAN